MVMLQVIAACSVGLLLLLSQTYNLTRSSSTTVQQQHHAPILGKIVYKLPAIKK